MSKADQECPVIRPRPLSVPGMITRDISKVFRDPVRHFAYVARKCPFPNMAKWLRALVDEGRWTLRIDHSEYVQRAGFDWASDAVRRATIEWPKHQVLHGVPTVWREYFSLVGEVDPTGFGIGGELYGGPFPFIFSLDPRTEVPMAPREISFRGASPDADQLFFTPDGRAGWFSIHSHRFEFLGSGTEAIDAVYAQLLAGKAPSMDGDV